MNGAGAIGAGGAIGGVIGTESSPDGMAGTEGTFGTAPAPTFCTQLVGLKVGAAVAGTVAVTGAAVMPGPAGEGGAGAGEVTVDAKPLLVESAELLPAV